jgi:hypothetical protein
VPDQVAGAALADEAVRGGERLALSHRVLPKQVAEAALADEAVRGGERLALSHRVLPKQVAEAALADEAVRGGERLALQRRALRLGKPPRRWKPPAWADQVPREPPEVRGGFQALCSCNSRRTCIYTLVKFPLLFTSSHDKCALLYVICFSLRGGETAC